MSRRLVLLGWAGECLDLDSPDAETLVKEGLCRVSFTKFGGPLADATVLQFTSAFVAGYPGAPGSDGSPERAAMRRVVTLCALDPEKRLFTLEGGTSVAREGDPDV